MLLGMPDSQPLGEFHGREETLEESESVLAQPPPHNPASAAIRMASTDNLAVRIGFILRDHFIPLFNFAKLPAGQDIGD